MLGWNLGYLLSQAQPELPTLGFIKLSLGLAYLHHHMFWVGFQLLFSMTDAGNASIKNLGNRCLKYIYLPSLGNF